MSLKNTVELAAKLLQTTVEKAEEYSSDTNYPELTYYSVPVMGGPSLIISDHGEVLYANSSVGFDRHMEKFQSGERTPLEAFLGESSS